MAGVRVEKLGAICGDQGGFKSEGGTRGVEDGDGEENEASNVAMFCKCSVKLFGRTRPLWGSRRITVNDVAVVVGKTAKRIGGLSEGDTNVGAGDGLTGPEVNNVFV